MIDGAASSMTSGGLMKLSVVLRPDQVDRILDLSRRKRMKRAAVVRELIDLGLRQQDRIDKAIEAVA